MNSEELSQCTNHWYVTAGDGDVVVRVFPGMSLGEKETGELSLDGSDAMLSLSIGSDKLLVVFVLNGGELESEDGEFHGRRHLAFRSAALIALPNNTIRLDRDILGEAETDATLLPLAVWRSASAENRTPARDNIVTAQPPPAPVLNALEPSAPKHEEPQSISVTTEQPKPKPKPKSQKVPDKTTRSRQKRQKAIVATASAGVACVLIGLVYAGMRTPVTPQQGAPVAVAEVIRQTTVPAPLKEAPLKEAPTVALPDRGQIPDKIKGASAPIATQATAAPERTVVVAIPPNELMADDTTSTPLVAAAKPLSQNRPTPEVAERAAPGNTATTQKNTGSRRANRNSVRRREAARAAQAAAEAESRREQEQAQTALVRYERDLLAAELALVQGRLTQPPEDNAYKLYKQLVASNPESSEVRRGFQALGAALVNRAFAELAAKRWSDARATLAAAAEAGASPNLVADLSGEVTYQQHLADAEAGRFAALYPAAELVALNRTTPSLRRYAPNDIDKVQIEFTISIAGSVQDIEVLGTPPQRLERVVRQAVTDWRFEPVLSGTRPIPVRTRVGLEIP